MSGTSETELRAPPETVETVETENAGETGQGGVVTALSSTDLQAQGANQSHGEAKGAAAAGGASAGPEGLSPLPIVEEFRYLLEKSTELFSGLRDLPQTGRSWQPYFQKAFEVYTKLWKFQQQQRAVLENREYFGLKRWEIGEIASKIGQLYYHYYLRTSETNYLYEAYVFYEAIRDRQYFKDVLALGTPSLVIKKLRYYARFIVASLLLNRYEMIETLMAELTELVDSYMAQYKPTDGAEWAAVLSEITTFMGAEQRLAPSDTGHPAAATPVRLQVERTPKFDRDGAPRLRLQEAVLVGNCAHQVKFSELTIDMYRMLQSLEREPASTLKAGAGQPAGAADVPATRRTHPHKYLLYRPTVYQLLTYVVTAFKDVGEHAGLFVYFSADKAPAPAVTEETAETGEAAAVKALFQSGVLVAPAHQQATAADTLHPGDLIPFTRKPLFMVVDSPGSAAFSGFSGPFGDHTLVLLSPTAYPAALPDTAQVGSLFSLFLHSPLKALYFCAGAPQVALEAWQQAVALVAQLETALAAALDDASVLGAQLAPAHRLFLQDDFGSKFVCRFILCVMALQAHADFVEPEHFPTAHPALPAAALAHAPVVELFQELVRVLGAESRFDFSAGVSAA